MADILIIDDDVQILWLLRKMLEQDGHSIISAQDGIKGTKMYRDAPVDLVITDMIMPNQSGINLISELIDAFPDIKIIAISGGGAIEPNRYLDLAMSLGAKAALTKPFTMEKLLATVQDVLGLPASSQTTSAH